MIEVNLQISEVYVLLCPAAASHKVRFLRTSLKVLTQKQYLTYLKCESLLKQIETGQKQNFD